MINSDKSGFTPKSYGGRMERETKESPANKQQGDGWAVSLGTADQCVPGRCGKTVGQRRQGQCMTP